MNSNEYFYMQLRNSSQLIQQLEQEIRLLNDFDMEKSDIYFLPSDITNVNKLNKLHLLKNKLNSEIINLKIALDSIII